ncbi:hypothetical protein [Haladaptatus sp. DYSN1]|uniref:hypothetical protein n=1 Tax=unclassified Haladaptatus TaxID=2622732 RepID=UPI002405F39C|nr:hypothetical protein [Haladaptatus sp. DYSN1]
MNVFWLDEDPRKAARYHCDQHVNKMLLEAAQILSTTLRAHGHDEAFLYQPTHTGHPTVKWASHSRENWLRLYEFAGALNEEFMERFGHDEAHASWRMLQLIDRDSIAIPAREPTEPPQCMPEEYCREDLVDAYRAYYANDKEWAEWKYTAEPDWLLEYRLNA